MLHAAIDPMYYVNGSISLPRTCPYPAAAPDHSDRFKRVAALIEAHNISLGPGFAPTIANPLLAMPGKAPIIAVIASRRENHEQLRRKFQRPTAFEIYARTDSAQQGIRRSP